jgi:translocation and assembly module TamB
MTAPARRKRWRWLKHVAWVLGVWVVLATCAAIVFFGSGAGNPLLRRVLIRRLEFLTGGRVEVRTVSIRWFSLGASLKGVAIHGREPAGTEPLFKAEEVRLGLRVDSFWGRKVSLDDLFVQQPEVHIRVERNGSTNIPPPRTASAENRLLPGPLLDLRIHRVLIQNGWVLYNDVRSPLALEGNDLRLTLDNSGTPSQNVYLGALDWPNVRWTADSFWPLPVALSAKFTLRRSGFTLEQGILTAGRSHLDAQAELQDYSNPKWNFRYRGWINLLDLRETLRSPETPTGRVDVRGDATLAGGQFHGTGTYSGQDITLTYLPIFHAAGLSSRGTFHIDNKGLDVPDFLAEAFGGTVKGRVTMRFDGLKFQATTRLQGMRLASVFPSLEEPSFPADDLHWDAVLSADSVETWTAGFQHFDISAKMQWSSPDEIAEGHIPVDGDWDIRYQYDPEILTVRSGEFETPSSRGTLSGVYARDHTALDLHFETGALESYRDFINAVRDVRPQSPDAVKVISGTARWDGKITGPFSDTVFTGRMRGEGIQYEQYTLDSLDGDIVYSGEQLTISGGHARRGNISGQIDGTLALSNWTFLPANTWSADASLEGAPVEALQELIGKSYPIRGQLTGQFHGRGTREQPAVTGLFDLAEGEVYGLVFNRLRGQLTLNKDEARIANAELRLFPLGKEAGSGAGIVTGSAGYTFSNSEISADLVGASLPLRNFETLQAPRTALDGLVSFRLKATGPATAPLADGTFRVVDLRIGPAVIGSFDGGLTSDGRMARLTLGSAMTNGEISGGFTLGLSEPFPIDGKVLIRNIDLDPFLLSALHVEQANGHAKADGEIALKGSLRQPNSLVFDANFTHLVFNYATVQLENVGPVHLRSSRESLQVDPATFRGADTNLQVDGTVQFTNRRTLDLRLNGALDLRLLASLAPGLSIGGPAQINATFEGSLDRPHITGRIHIENASARVVDFPTGLSALQGDFIFDATRLYFDNVTAQAGGGTLHLSGSVNYTDRPLRYDITARSDGTRVRYPEGMSWLTAGTLRLTGTTDGGLLSGRVTVERVTLTQGLEVAGALISTKEGISGPSATSPFLRNLQFDIEGVSAPDARMQWPGAELEAEANLRVRGTWEHPILLGHIHVLSGELLFHGNRYQVARGDINFANPFRLDPVVNVEASTTIQQYEITLNFNGPASKLTLAYRSDPPLPGNDIVTLLAMGQTSSEGTVRSGGTTQSSTSSGASAILSEAVSSQVGGRLEKLFGITNFRVDPGLTGVGASGAEQNAAARVTVQQQVTRNMTVTYVSNVGSTQQQVIQVEYNVNRNVSIVALRDYNGTFGIDIKIKKRFP